MNLSPEHRLRGLVAATFTPFHPDGSLNLDLIPALVDQLEADGVRGLYIAGSTGEGPSLSADERRAVSAAYVQAARGRLRTVVQVGHNSLAEARGFAQHAQEIGADAISAMPPSYFKPESTPVLIDSMARVADGARDLPFYYYHIPSLTGVEPDMVELLSLAAERVPSLAGIKFSDTRLHHLQVAQRFDGGSRDVVFGVDEMLLGALAFGVRGAVGSTYCFAAPLYLPLIEHVQRGEIEQAARLQARSGEMVRVISRHCGRSGLKAVMSLIGLDCGPSRLPQHAVSPEAVEAMRAGLEEIGFFDWGRSS